MIDVALFATHPIQYQVPWFRALSNHSSINLTVYYEHIPTPEDRGRGFGVSFEWDLPLLQGYTWRVRKGISVDKDQRIGGVRQALCRDSTNVVLVTGWHDLFLIQAAMGAKALGTPVIVRGDSNAMEPRSIVAEMGHRVLFALYDRFLVIGKSNKSFYMGYNIERNRMHKCPYFVDNKRFNEEYEKLAGKEAEIKNYFGVPKDRLCLLFAGKFTGQKRVIDILRSLENLSSEVKPHLLLVGDGKKRKYLEEIVKGNSLPVTFTGFLNQTEISEAYMAGDVIILPADYEAWGLVINEAMIFECPAIVSDRVGCGPDLVEEGETGFTFAFGNVNELAECIRWMVEHPNRRQVMGRQAREKVLKEYSVERGVEGTMEAVHAACSVRQEK